MESVFADEAVILVDINRLYSVQNDLHELKSLKLELAEHEDMNPYKKNEISDSPKGSGGKDYAEWWAERKSELEELIAYCLKKIQIDRKEVDEYIKAAPHPEQEIIRFRIINNLGWYEIGEEIGADRRTVSRKFYDYINKN